MNVHYNFGAGMAVGKTRARILDATAELLVRDGPQCSMSAIATTAGVAIGSLYNHFESKDALIRAVYERLAEELDAAVIREWDDGAEPSVQLDAYINDYIDFFWTDNERAVLFEILSSLPLVTPAELLAHFVRSADYIADILARLKAGGMLRDAEPGQMAGFIGGAIRNTLKWRRLRPPPLTAKERENISAMCKASLARQPDGVSPPRS